ncbi:MAG: helix-turn-helix domain-containing protein [Pseudomonadota bacterium]
MKTYEIDEMIELGRWAYKAEPIQIPGLSSHGALDFRTSHDLVVTFVHLPGFRLDHNPRELRAYDNDYVLFEIVESGSKHGLVEETYSQQTSRNVTLIDMSRRYRCVVNDVRGAGILIPHKKIGFDPSKHLAYYSHEVRSERGHLLLTAATLFLNKLRRFDPPGEIAPFSAAFLGLVRVLFMNEADPQHELQPDSREAVLKSLIDKNLTNPVLKPGYLASRLGMSRSSLYRMFKDEGGIARYVAERRLQAAFADLLGSSAERGAVRRAAERWGFQDQSLFNRRFRQRFGLTPKDCIMGDGAFLVGDNGGAWHPVFDWMSKKGQLPKT